METKICSICKQKKSIDDFYWRRTKNIFFTWCKKCNIKKGRINQKIWREKNATFDYTKEKTFKCISCHQIKSSFLFPKNATTSSGYGQPCKACHSSAVRKTKYGITPDLLKTLLEQQNFKCAICGFPFEKIFCVDHSHKTEVVRGILCHACNKGIGQLKDSPAVLRSAAVYLENYSKPQEVSNAS